MEFKKAIPYQISITASANNCYMVECGCVKLAFTEPKALTNALLEYLKDPEKAEKEYNEAFKQDSPVPTGMVFHSSL